jgi:hypothetical protein
MAVELTTITGKVLLPGGGAPPAGSRALIRLSAQGRAEDGSVTQVVGGVVEAVLDSAGSIFAADGVAALTLVPNDAITPTGTFYRVDFSIKGGLGWQELWNLTTAPDPVQIGDIQRLSEGTLITVAPTGYATSVLPTAAESMRGQIWNKQGAAGVADQLVVCLKGIDNLYDWIVISEGE